MAQQQSSVNVSASARSGTRETKLSVTNVSKSFELASGKTLDAVVGASFEVLDNEVCILLGPSGCGKSTVLRMVAGLEDPTSGSLKLNDREIHSAGGDRGMVFQSYTSFDWLTVRQNVEYGMRLNNVSRAERKERADHFIDLVKLTKFRDAYPSQLSGGMKQRVAIARTLANDPEMLLMDEPFGALDAETRWVMQELLLEIMENSETTILMVTHDIEEAIFLADRIIFMSPHPGRVTDNMLTEYKHGRRISKKEEAIEMDGFADLERHIMRLMRDTAHDIPPE